MHCGLASIPRSNPIRLTIWSFSKRLLPNVNILLVPYNIQLPQPVIDIGIGGEMVVAEVGKKRRGKTAEEIFEFYANFFNTAVFWTG